MRSIEWAFLFAVSAVGIALANLVGFQVGIVESLPVILILVALSLAGMACTKLIPLKLPIVAYVSILGLLVAGIGVEDQLGFFARQGWKMVVVGIVFMTGSFVITAIISQLLLTLTGAI